MQSKNINNRVCFFNHAACMTITFAKILLTYTAKFFREEKMQNAIVRRHELKKIF